VPVEFGVWRIDGTKTVALDATGMSNERRLEDVLAENVDVLGLAVMLIGRQVPTEHGGYIDLLGLDVEGKIYVIELKRDRTPREVVAQVLDYASWVSTLTYDDVSDIYSRHGVQRDIAFEEAFDERFGDSPPESLNDAHRLVIVASALDPSTERIVTYLADQHAVPLNAVFFRYFVDSSSGAEYLGRSWMIDPTTVEAKANRATGRREPWNGHDYYATFGPSSVRAWEDGRRYGFISASGGSRWIKPLRQLSRGDRVFALVPGKGYVGVGIVQDPVVPITEFEVEGRPLLEHPLQSPGLDLHVDDPEAIEHVVRVRWLCDVPENEGYWEKGMFANQNSVCPLRQSFTLEKVVQHFDVPDYVKGS
jgi:hypothetical protein